MAHTENPEQACQKHKGKRKKKHRTQLKQRYIPKHGKPLHERRTARQNNTNALKDN